MGPYSVPKEILALKPPKTMVKKIKGNYYVYEYVYKREVFTDEKGVQHKKTKTLSGNCIGKITLEEGFVPNGRKNKESEEQIDKSECEGKKDKGDQNDKGDCKDKNENKSAKDSKPSKSTTEKEITIKSYGEFAYAYQASQETYALLKKHFHVLDAQKIYCVALINFINGFTSLHKIKNVYENSFLSLAFPEPKMGYDSLSTFYINLGCKTRLPENFTQDIIDSSSKLLSFEEHVISSSSGQEYLSEYEYKYRGKRIDSKQVIWITIHDLENGRPLANRFFMESEFDPMMAEELLTHWEFKNTHFQVGRNFNQESIKKLMSRDGNTYTMPMIPESKSYQYVIEHLDLNPQDLFIYNGNTILYQTFSGFNGDRYIAFKDLTRADLEYAHFLSMSFQDDPNTKSEKLNQTLLYFGLYLFETNHHLLSPEEIFNTYWKRSQVKTYYDYVKQDLNFKSFYQKDYSMLQGLGFITYISELIYHDIQRATRTVSCKNALDTLSALKLSLENNSWRAVNYTKEVRKLCDKIKFDVDMYRGFFS